MCCVKKWKAKEGRAGQGCDFGLGRVWVGQGIVGLGMVWAGVSGVGQGIRECLAPEEPRCRESFLFLTLLGEPSVTFSSL